VSFDPQNPRAGARPTPLPSTPPTPPPTSSKQPSYIPPQPVNRGPSRNVIVAIGAVIALLVAGILSLLVLNLLKGTPAASPSPSASTPAASHAAPTTARSPNGSLVPSSASPPLGPPTVRPTPGGSIVVPSAGTPEAALLGHVPDTIRAACSTGISTDGAALAVVNCVPSATVSVSYTQYADATSMDAAYEQIFSALQIDQDSGSCEDHTTWPAESSYEVEGQPAGRRVCVDASGSATIYWTDDRLLILSTANSASADADALLEFWTNEAGPLP
jgi:hypothetical protein